MLEYFKNKLPKQKSKAELDEHYEGLELEKGDFTAMVIAAFITFMPVILFITAIIIGIAYLFLL